MRIPLNISMNDVEKQIVTSKNRFLLNHKQKLHFSDNRSFKKEGINPSRLIVHSAKIR